MNATTVAVGFAKPVFQLAKADASWRLIEKHRLTRTPKPRAALGLTARTAQV